MQIVDPYLVQPHRLPNSKTATDFHGEPTYNTPQPGEDYPPANILILRENKVIRFGID
jgi:hypothetical protein